MRRLLYIVCFAFLVSCVKVQPIQNRKTDVAWNVVCKNHSTKCDEIATSPMAPRNDGTKSASAFSNTGDFESIVWKLGAGKTWNSHKDEATQEAKGTVWYDNNHWRMKSSPVQWPDEGSLSFLSYTAGQLIHDAAGKLTIDSYSLTPLTAQKSKIVATKTGLKVNNWNSETDSNIDLLVADIQIDKTVPSEYLGNTGIVTEFHHLLSKVSFQFYKSDQPIHYNEGDIEHTTITLKHFEVRNIWKEGTLSNGGVAGEHWSFDPANVATKSLETKVLFNGSQVLNTSNPIIFEDLYIPQEMDDYLRTARNEITFYLVFDVTYAGTTTTKIATIKADKKGEGRWAIGKAYNYVVHLGYKLAPIEFTAEASEWIDGTEGLINGGEFNL